MEKIFLKKNDIVSLTVTDMAEGGEGIGRANGYPLFVKDAGLQVAKTFLQRQEDEESGKSYNRPYHR